MKDAPVMVILRKWPGTSARLFTRTEVLLLKRHSDHPLFPDEWCLPGGKRNDQIKFMYGDVAGSIPNGREYIESNEEAIYRECKEELGKVHVFKDTGIIMVDDHYVMKVYLAISKVNVTKEFPNREHIQYGWFDIKDLPEKTSSVTRDLLENYEF